MAASPALQMLVEGHHGGMGSYLGLHWAWWLVWLVIGVGLIWALARMLDAPTGAALRERDGDGGTHGKDRTRESSRR